MKKLIIVIAMMVMIGTHLTAGSPKPVDKKIMHYIFNAEWQKADSLITIELRAQPDNPRYHFLKAPMYFYTRYFARGNFTNDSLLNLTAAAANKAIELAEEMDKTPEIKFILGSAYGYLSRVQVIRREYWNGYWSARDSRNYLEDVLEKDPGNADALMGLAAIEYFPAVGLNGFVGTMAWLAGMSGDRDKGLDYFHKTAEKGILFNDEAAFVLAVMYQFRENDPKQALALFNSLNFKYPNNGFFAGQYRQAQFSDLIDRMGVAYLRDNIDSLKTIYEITNSFPLNRMGYRLINENRFEEAEMVFQLNISLYPEVANCYDSMGECFMRQGKNDEAILFYKLAYEKLETDESMNAANRENLKNGIIDRLKELGVKMAS